MLGSGGSGGSATSEPIEKLFVSLQLETDTLKKQVEAEAIATKEAVVKRFDETAKEVEKRVFSMGDVIAAALGKAGQSFAEHKNPLAAMTAGINAANDAMKIAAQSGNSFAGALVPLVGAIAGVTGGVLLLGNAVSQVTGFLSNMAKQGVQTAMEVQTGYAGAIIAAKNLGTSTAEVDSKLQSLQATGITTRESLNTLSQFMSQRLDITNLDQLARAAQDRAKALGQDSSAMLNRFTTAIMTGNSEWLRTVGITKSATQMMEEYAVKLGKAGAESLTLQQRQEAMIAGIIKANQGFTGLYETAQGLIAGAQQSNKRYIEEAQLALGQMLFKFEMVGVEATKKIFQGIQQAIVKTKEITTETGEKKTVPIMGAGGEFELQPWAASIQKTVDQVTKTIIPIIDEWVPKLIKGLRDVLDNVVTPIFDTINKALPKISTITNDIIDFISTNRELIAMAASFASIAVAIGTIAAIIGAVAGPLSAIAAVAVPLMGVAVAASAIGAGLSKLIPYLTGTNSLPEAFAKIQKEATVAFDYLKLRIEDLKPVFLILQESLNQFIKSLVPLGATVKDVMSVAGEGVKILMDALGIEDNPNFWSDIWTAGREAFAIWLASTVSGIKLAASELDVFFKFIARAFEDLKTKNFADLGKAFQEEIVDKQKGIADSFEDAFEKVFLAASKGVGLIPGAGNKNVSTQGYAAGPYEPIDFSKYPNIIKPEEVGGTLAGAGPGGKPLEYSTAAVQLYETETRKRLDSSKASIEAYDVWLKAKAAEWEAKQPADAAVKNAFVPKIDPADLKKVEDEILEATDRLNKAVGRENRKAASDELLALKAHQAEMIAAAKDGMTMTSEFQNSLTGALTTLQLQAEMALGIQKDLYYKLVKMRDDFNYQQGLRQTQFDRQRLLAQQALDHSISELQRTTNRDLEKADREFQIQQQRDLANHLFEMQRMEQSYNLNLADAVQNRDAKAVIMLMRQHEVEKRQANQQYDKQQRDQVWSHNHERELRQQAMEIQIADMKRNFEYQQKLQQDQYDYETQLQKTAFERQIQQTIEGLAAEGRVTREQLNDVVKAYQETFGDKGSIDKYFDLYLRKLEVMKSSSNAIMAGLGMPAIPGTGGTGGTGSTTGGGDGTGSTTSPPTAPPPATAPQSGYATGNMTVRARPSPDAAIVDYLSEGKTTTIYGKSGDGSRYAVHGDMGRSGWASSAYWNGVNANLLPTLSADASFAQGGIMMANSPTLVKMGETPEMGVFMPSDNKRFGLESLLGGGGGEGKRDALDIDVKVSATGVSPEFEDALMDRLADAIGAAMPMSRVKRSIR